MKKYKCIKPFWAAIPGGVQTAVKPMRWIMTNMIIARTAGSE